MTFDEAAQWLLCAAIDGSLFLIPAYFLMFKSKIQDSKERRSENSPSLTQIRNASSGTFSKREYLKTWIPFRTKKDDKSTSIGNLKWDPGAVNEITYLPSVTKSKQTTTLQNCIWWKAKDGSNYAILVFFEGLLSFIDLSNNSQETIKTRFPIERVELVTTTVGNRVMHQRIATFVELKQLFFFYKVFARLYNSKWILAARFRTGQKKSYFLQVYSNRSSKSRNSSNSLALSLCLCIEPDKES